MVRQCARPGCSAPAAATFNFDGLARVVWLGPLADARAMSAGDLCRRHADRLRPPLHWELRDMRAEAPTVSVASVAPSRHVAPPPPPEEPLPFEPARVRPVTSPVRVVPAARDEPDRPEQAPATTPLLARAFRAAG